MKTKPTLSLLLLILSAYLILQTNQQTYKVSNKQDLSDQKHYHDLDYTGSPSYYKKPSSPVVKQAQLQIRKEKKDQLDLKIIDRQNNRFEIPKDVDGLEDLYKDIENPEKLPENQDYLYEYKVYQDPFCVEVSRKSTQETIFSTCKGDLVFSDLYLEISTTLPTDKVFGFGERNPKSLRLEQGGYTLYGRDEPSVVETNELGNNVYGSHPMYLVREKSGNWNAVFFKYSGGMDVLHDQNKLTIKTIGGIFHFKIFLGDKNPETVIKQYHEYLGGGHTIPPFWSFGFHQCRWGYKTLNKLIEVSQKHKNLRIPIDTIWSDIDFMIEKQTFSVDSSRFPEHLYKELHNKHKMRYVPIVDVAVGNQKYPKDEALVLGKQMDVFCKSPETGYRFKGKVWPGPSYFPDFLHPNASEFWTTMMTSLHDKTNFTGMWLDMNEPANFCNGECPNKEYVDKDVPNQTKDESYLHKPFDFPYLMGGGRKYRNVNEKTLPGELLHFGKYYHKDVHNLYGLLDMIYTNRAMTQKMDKPLPFILSRSTFPGSGKFGQHWCGDNHSSWDFLRISVPQIILFNFFGIPMSGSDVCGFMGSTTEHLCLRWIQVAALQPFFRNHNVDTGNDQEFYVQGSRVQETARKNLRLRYSLLKFYYTQFIKTNRKGTVYRPLFFNFPSDEETYKDTVMNEQYMVGQEIMATPVLYENIDLIKPYFPGNWNELITGQKVHEGYNPVYSTYDDLLPVFIREGKTIPYQPQYATSTLELDNNYQLISSLKQGHKYKERYNLDSYSVGYLMNLENFQDEQSVVDQCLGDNSCLMKIIVGVAMEKGHKVIKLILIHPKPVVSNLHFTSLRIYNLEENINFNLRHNVSKLPSSNSYIINIEKWNPCSDNTFTVQLN